MAKAETGSKEWTLQRVFPWILIICGAIALMAAAALTTEVFDHLKNPHFVPVCNLNPILSCTNVADSNQAHAFGIPNEFIGLAGYAAIVTIGVAMLAGGKFKRWFWQLVQVGLTFAFLFMTWLQFQTLYRIGTLCLFCMVLWAMTGPLFWYATLYNLRMGSIKTPKKLNGVVAFAQRHHADILIAWFLIIIALILKRFWYYWSTLI